jgi:hypothetical protein
MPKCQLAVLIDEMPDDDRDHWLVCMLDEGHAGQHWDSKDNVIWKVGRPDE